MSIKRIVGIIFAYVVTCTAWMVLAGVTHQRTGAQSDSLEYEVADLWGESQTQRAPTLEFRAFVPATAREAGSRVISAEEAETLKLKFPPPTPAEEKAKAEARKKAKAEAKAKGEEAEEPAEDLLWVHRQDAVDVSLAASDIDVNLHSTPRRKGLVWHALYDVSFAGKYRYVHEATEAGYLDLSFALPSENALYDGLVFEVDGKDYRTALNPAEGSLAVSLPVQPDSTVVFKSAYRSRGADEWNYVPSHGIQRLESFLLTMSADFKEIDFPSSTLSPSSKQREDWGWLLVWDFESTVTGHGMGMVMPARVQPGELATALIFSAPVSLLFFFLVIFILATLKKLDIHPINYLFLGASFFAFHLLFSYSADHLSVPTAFALSSVTSMALVVSYLRLVVSPKFALREAALAQLVYLIGFSLAHFWQGFTGLTITVLAILTLFLVMQATGRLRWSEIMAGARNTPLPGPQAPGPLAPLTQSTGATPPSPAAAEGSVDEPASRQSENEHVNAASEDEQADETEGSRRTT